MFPGMGRGVNPRKMKSMMRKMGMDLDELGDVEEVIIKTSDKKYIFHDAAVTVMTVQGQKTFQIVGEPDVEESEGEGGIVIPEEDIQLVMAQSGASYDDAKKALEENEGNPAEAIISLMS